MTCVGIDNGILWRTQLKQTKKHKRCSSAFDKFNSLTDTMYLVGRDVPYYIYEI